MTASRTRADAWIRDQRAVVLRLPRWLVGSAVVASFALGVEWMVTGSGPAPWFAHFFQDTPAWGPAVAMLATVALPVQICVIALYVVARIVRPPPPSNLPGARVQ
jgi:hypothetical protein